MKKQTTQFRFADRVSHVPQNFIREILKVASDPSMLSFAGGLPNPEFFPVNELADSTQKVFRTQGQKALQYHVTEGYFPLREYIAMRYKRRCGLDISPDQVLITNGSQQALDIIGKLFINPGDEVLVERPTYLGALQCLSMYSPVFREVTLEHDGLAIDELDEHLAKHTIKLFYGIPDFQNPTGTRHSIEKRRLASEVFSRHQTLVVEDDPYGEIIFNDDPFPKLYSYIPDQTILLGSFSKIISPGMRLGWMVATAEIIRKATVMKQASDLHSGNLTQFILHQFLTDYDLDDHILKIKNAYRSQRDVMTSAIKEYFPSTVRYTEPDGGMFLWMTLPDVITSRELLSRAMEKKIVFVPGDTFYAATPDTQTLRLNFSNVDPGRMKNALRVLASLIS
jgi:2-aminoadipate transaminase